MLDEAPEISQRDGATSITIRRPLPQPLERVWEFLTSPERLPLWLAPGQIEPWQGGSARINFKDSGIVIDSIVTQYNPPHSLHYSWSSPAEPLRPLEWDLARTSDGCTLTLRMTTPASEDAARAAAGFEAHLDMLAAALEGVPISFPFARFKELRATYAARLDGLAR